MTLRSAQMIAFDGTHASGKTTLLHAVTADLRSRGVHVTCLPEPARSSPLVDDVVIHNVGVFDMPLELDLFAAHITNCVRAARSYDVVLTDKTITNVLAYARMLITVQPGSWDEAMFGALESFCRAWAPAYDAVFYCQDRFSVDQKGDKYRAKVTDLQDRADTLVQNEYQTAQQALIKVPAGLSLADRTNWIINQLARLGIPSHEEVQQ